MRRPRGPGEWRDGFLEVLRRSGRIDLAADCADVSRWSVYYHLRKDPEFSAAVKSAKAELAAAATRGALVKFRRAVG